MEKYICKECNKESRIQLVWSGDMTIEGESYHIENAKCEHCEEITNIKKVKLT